MRARPAGPIGGLGLSFEEVANTPPTADVIEQLEGRRLGLRHRLDRQPDDCVRAEQPPRILDRHVVLSHMDAVGAGGERDVDTVIDRAAGCRMARAPP